MVERSEDVKHSELWWSVKDAPGGDGGGYQQPANPQNLQENIGEDYPPSCSSHRCAR